MRKSSAHRRNSVVFTTATLQRLNRRTTAVNCKVNRYTFISEFPSLVEASTTRGTTALVYCLINSSLYTVQVLFNRWWSTPNWIDGHQGSSQLSTGLPPSSGLGWEEKRSEVQPLGGARWRDGYRVCGDCEGTASPRHAKLPRQVGKLFRDPSRGSAREEEGEETSRSENESCLVAARPPGREPGDLP